MEEEKDLIAKTLADIEKEGLSAGENQSGDSPSFQEEPIKKKSKVPKIILLILSTLLILAIGAGLYYYFFLYQKEEASSNSQISQTTSGEQEVFELKLFKEVNTKEVQDQNLLISPLSVSTALMLAYNGADGNTATEFKDLLEVDSLETANNEYQTLLTDLNKQEDVTLEIANSVWLKKEKKFLDSYAKNVESFLFSEVKELTTVEPINAWVSEKTNNKIEKVLDYLDPMTSAILTNAVYFNGKWTETFAKEDIREQNFTTADKKVKTDFLTQSSEYLYYEDNDLQTISLPYGESKRFVMDFYLPKKDDGITKLEDKLNADNLEKWNKREKKQGHIEIPKFKFENDFQKFRDNLISLGLKDAFDSRKADFSKMAEEENYISRVIHKTYIDLNEEGTEAAAATSVGMTLSAAAEEEPKLFQFIADHPFLFVLRDTETEKVLFIGRLSDPTK